MKSSHNIAVIIIMTGILSACSSGYHREMQAKDETAPPVSHNNKVSSNAALASEEGTLAKANADSSAQYMSSSAAMAVNNDTSGRYIRTAYLHYRVNSVIKATYKIEDIVRHFGGVVTYTGLHSSVDNTTLTQVSADSSLETTYYTMYNDITLRIPYRNLDTTLKCMAPLVDFLDYRTIRASNVRFDLYADVLKQQRLERHTSRLAKAIDEHGKKLGETTEAENDMLGKEEDEDNAKLDNFKRDDSIKNSVIVLYIYQRPTLKRVLIANDKNIDAYTPGFFHRLGEAIKTGWDMLVEIILALANIWTILLIFGGVGYWIYKVFRKPKQ